jgi:hypothetical protein
MWIHEIISVQYRFDVTSMTYNEMFVLMNIYLYTVNLIVFR